MLVKDGSPSGNHGIPVFVKQYPCIVPCFPADYMYVGCYNAKPIDSDEGEDALPVLLYNDSASMTNDQCAGSCFMEVCDVIIRCYGEPTYTG
jgi:hypothetical protein